VTTSREDFAQLAFDAGDMLLDLLVALSISCDSLPDVVVINIRFELGSGIFWKKGFV
jgi:hypothetical protein